METRRFPLFVALTIAMLAGAGGCGGSDPEPDSVLDRALTRENLAGFGVTPAGQGAGVVAVQALGYEDRVLEERRVGAPRPVMAEIREALGADSGLRGLATGVEYEGTAAVGGAETDHISGQLDEEELAGALERAGAAAVGSLAGLEAGESLGESVAGASFDLYAGAEDGVIRRLDLTLALDDPDNALPPARIRFSLTPAAPADPTT